MEVRIVRSRRRTLGLEVRGETVLVRAPYGLPNTEIQRFLTEHQDWVAKARARQADRQARRQPLTGSEIQDLTRKAKAVIPERVRFYAEKLGVPEDAIVTPELAARLLEREALHTRVLVNQVETEHELALARELAEHLHCPVAAGALQKENVICLC